MSNHSLMEKLEDVISKGEGLIILRENSDLLTDELVDKLRLRAKELNAAGDSDGALEFEEWAWEARSIITRREIISTSPSNVEEAMQFLKAKHDRYDDAFIDLNVRIAGIHLERLRQALERLKQGEAEAMKSAIEAADSTSTEVGILKIVAQLTQQPFHQAQALLNEGYFLLLRAQLEMVAGDQEKAANTRMQAEIALTACAENQAAPASIRARAEGNLAALAGPEHMDKVNKHQATAQRLAEEAGDRDVLRTVRRDRAYWARQYHNWAAAFDLYLQNIEDTERELWKEYSPILGMELVSATVPDYEAIVEVCLEWAKTETSYYERALEFAEQGKARAFLRVMANIGSALGPVPPRLLQRHKKIIRQMQQLGATLAVLPSDQAERYLPEASMLQRALGMTEGQIEKHAHVRALNLQCVPCTFTEIVKLVPPGGAILSYFSLPERMLLFLVDEGGLVIPPVEIPLSSYDLARAMVNIELTIRIRSDYEVYDKLQRKLDMEVDYFWPKHNLHFLYHKLIEPVKDHIIGRKLIYIVPHGSLAHLPFNALLQPNGEALIDEVPIAYTPSLSVLRQCRERRRSGIETCFAAGVAANLSGLNSTQNEATVVAKLFGVKPYPATRAAVLNQAVKCDLLHLACHSNLGNALTNFQGLVLEDGPLFQHEIAAMGCKASHVTLSACETAGSDVLPKAGREMAGLVGAFFRAGCPSVMASLWPISDRVALPMMNAFYSALKSGNTDKASALRQAQQAIKAMTDQGFDHPYYWAPFCLWGDV